MNIFITGIRGFLGRHLACHLAACGHAITGSTSRPRGTVATSFPLYEWQFGQPFDATTLQGLDVVIHCAHDFAAGEALNLSGTRAVATAARRAGVARQVLISSLAARPDASSRYGRTKFAIERAVRDDDLFVLRPGTLIGEGGLFGRLCRTVATAPIIPLVGSGRGRLYLISVSDMCLATEAVVQRDPPDEFNLYYEATPTLREVLDRLRRLYGRRAPLIPLPVTALHTALAAAALLGLRLPVDRDSLRGFESSQDQPHATTLGRIVEQPQTLEEALEAMFRIRPRT